MRYISETALRDAYPLGVWPEEFGADQFPMHVMLTDSWRTVQFEFFGALLTAPFDLASRISPPGPLAPREFFRRNLRRPWTF